METFPYATANTATDACLDVNARGFWRRGQDAFFDVRVFYPNASSYRILSLSSAYKHHEDIKKREYGHRVREVQHGVFTSCVHLYWWYGSGGNYFLIVPQLIG